MSPGAPMPSQRRFAGLLLLATALWVSASALGSLTANAADGLAALYLPIGIAVALMLRNPGYWWAVALGAILGSLAIALATGGNANAALVGGSVNAIEAGVVAAAVRWQRAQGFRTPRDGAAFLLAALAGAALGAVLGGAALVQVSGTPFASTAQTWLAADLVGMLLVVPLATTVTWQGVRSRGGLRPVLLLVLSVGLAVLAIEATLLGLPFLVFLAWFALLLTIVVVGVRFGVPALGLAQAPAAVAAFILIRDASQEEWLLRQGIAAVIAASLLLAVLALRAELDQRTRSERLARDMFERLPVATARLRVTEVDDGGPLQVLDANDAWSHLFGGGGRGDLLRSIDPDDVPRLRAKLSTVGADPVEVRAFVRGTGQTGIVRILSVSMGRREADGWHSLVVAAQDVTAEREAERVLLRKASTDPLTGLMNRAAFEQTAAEWVAVEESGRIGLLFIDLDDFKAVNDTHGHQCVDAVLCEVARRMQAEVRPRDVPARLAGDEFVVLAFVDGPQDLDALRSRLADRLGRPVEVGERLIPCGASIGTALGRAGDTASALLERADQDMYRVKMRRGRAVSED